MSQRPRKDYPTTALVVNEEVENFGFIWQVINFKAIKDKPVNINTKKYQDSTYGKSDINIEFNVGDRDSRKSRWKLSMHANCYCSNAPEDKYISFVLHRVKDDDIIREMKGKISLLPNEKDCTTQKTIFSADFSYSYESGEKFDNLEEFVFRKSLLESADTYLPDNTLSVLCEMDITYKYSLTKLPFKASSYLKKHVSASNCIDDIQNMLQSKEHSDVTLRCGDDDFYAHKFILSVRSPVFSKMFQHDMAENQTNVVHITDVRSDVMKLLMSYVYGRDVYFYYFDEFVRRKLNITDTSIALYAAADKYEILDLKEQCSTILSENLKSNNFCRIASLADEHNDSKLFLSTQEYVEEHLHELLIFKKWFTFSEENPVLAKKLVANMK